MKICLLLWICVICVCNALGDVSPTNASVVINVGNVGRLAEINPYIVTNDSKYLGVLSKLLPGHSDLSKMGLLCGRGSLITMINGEPQLILNENRDVTNVVMNECAELKIATAERGLTAVVNSGGISWVEFCDAGDDVRKIVLIENDRGLSRTWTSNIIEICEDGSVLNERTLENNELLRRAGKVSVARYKLSCAMLENFNVRWLGDEQVGGSDCTWREIRLTRRNSVQSIRWMTGGGRITPYEGIGLIIDGLTCEVAWDKDRAPAAPQATNIERPRDR